MIDKIRMAAIQSFLRAVYWLARPSVRGRKFLQHYEIIGRMSTKQVRPGDRALKEVQRGSLFINGQEVLSTPGDQIADFEEK